jgi:Putative rRNA methylase.
MFNYVADISSMAHFIINNYCKNFSRAIDATLGNGFDTDFLCTQFNEIFAFDIQKCAIENYKTKNITKVHLIHDSHEFLYKYVTYPVDCIMYNLGFLPGGDKNLTTNSKSTVKSLTSALDLVNSNGLITICVYNGHEQGKIEREEIIKLLCSLSKNKFGVVQHSFINRVNAPELFVVEKK